ncbi:MAG: SpoIIE family protein phosphatase [Leptospiraceae bacterium]|nr:SpoIIE family protein phosphatase [Leptospiraceae bacterium]
MLARFFIFIIIFFKPIWAIDTIDISLVEGKSIGKRLEIYEDKTAKQSFEDILKNETDWKKSNEEIPNYTFSKSSYWVRFKVKSSEAESIIIELSNSLHDYVSCYIQKKDSEFEVIKTGDRMPVSTRKRFHYHFLFPTTISNSETKTIYFQFNSFDGLQEPIHLILWREKEFERYDLIRNFCLFFLLGSIGVMCIYNLMLFLSLKDNSYLFLVLFIIIVINFLFAYYGITPLFFLTDNPWLVNHIHGMIIGLKLITLGSFSKKFLRTSEFYKNWDKVLNGIIILSIIILVLSFILPFSDLMRYAIALSTTSYFSYCILGFVATFRGNRSAKFFLFAFFIYLIGSMILGMKGASILPTNIITEYSILLGAFIAVILFSFALADRFNELKKEKEDAEKKTLELESEMRLAKKIQESFIPKSPPQIEGLKINFKYRAMASVGGDFLDFRTDGKNLGALIADVSGHGLPASMIVSMVHLAFWLQKQDSLFKPELILENMNNILFKNIGKEFVTASYLYFDLENRKLFLGTAGHPPIIIWNHEKEVFEEKKAMGRIIGFVPKLHATTVELPLEKNSTILLYTDGVTEATNFNDELYGEERLIDFLRSRRGSSLNQLSEELIQELVKWSGGETKISDDIAFVLFEVN